MKNTKGAIKNMKESLRKALSIIMVLVLALTMFTACGAEDNSTDQSQGNLAQIQEGEDKNTEDPNSENQNTEDEDAQDKDNVGGETQKQDYVDYFFRNAKLLSQHYEKHGKDMGFASVEEYEKAASDVVNNPEALHKIEEEDGDDVYYVEDTNEFVVVSQDGYIRTYFLPSAGKKYFDRQ